MPECGAADHTVPHFFDCATRPTDLCPADLWERPRKVARFISSLPYFTHLPALPRPPGATSERPLSALARTGISNNNLQLRIVLIL